jgi:conjugal transfer pilus assembly protein TraB
MNDPATITPAMARRRQYLLLGGIAALVGGTALLGVTLTGSPNTEQRTAKPKSTSIIAPGSEVDPRDAWRGQADAQLKAIEQKSRDVSHRNSELEGQNKSMLERLKKLEQAGLTPLPPPPVAVPPLRQSFGPDRPAGESVESPAGPQRLPPPPAPRALTAMPAGTMTQPTGIISIALADAPNARATADTKASKGAPTTQTTLNSDGTRTGNTAATGSRDTRRYLPSGTFTRAILLGGLDAPTGGQAQRNPQPVLLRLSDNAVLPNHFRARIKECFVVGAGYGDVSSERAYIRTESLSCVMRDGTAIDIPVKGYIAGEDGKAGMRGRLVSKQGQILANALVAGVASGIGHAFQQGATTFAISPLGSTGNVEHGKQLEAGLGTGVGKALDRLAQYYISLAEKVFPVIEIDAGRAVDVVLTTGVSLQGVLDEAAQDRETFPQLAERSSQLNRKEDDEDQ